MFRGEHDFAEDIIACALNISKRYNGSSKRADTLEHITTTIFDSMKKCMAWAERTPVSAAGRYFARLWKIYQPAQCRRGFRDIIMATEMIGLSHMERRSWPTW